MKRSLNDAPSVERPPRLRVTCQDACWWEENAEDIEDFCAIYINPLHDWQSDVLACWAAEDDDGKYVHQTCGLLVPRQNGKTEDIEGRIAYGLIYANCGRGEVIAYSAHRVDTTLEMFEKLLDLFGDSRLDPKDWKHPELHELVESETFTNGHQAIRMKNGAKVMFNARSTGSKRGFTCDVQIYDEAGFLTDDQLSASKSTVSSAPQKNPQTIYAGTPPSEQSVYAEPFGRTRQNAIAGMSGICWHEWSIADFEPAMLSDRNVWAEVNPSLGKNLLWTAVESELADMSPEKFAIERLCWWPDTASAHVFNAQKWAALESSGPKDEDISKLAVGVKFASDGLQVCASIAALTRGDSRTQDTVHVELVHNGNTLSGVQWLVDWLMDRREEVASVAIDGKSGADNLGGMLIRAGFPRKAVHIMTSGEVVTATTMTVNMLAEGRMTHYPDETLDASVRCAVKRKIGTDGYGLGGDSCAAESACAALMEVVTTRRDPNRKMRVL